MKSLKLNLKDHNFLNFYLYIQGNSYIKVELFNLKMSKILVEGNSHANNFLNFPNYCIGFN